MSKWNLRDEEKKIKLIKKLLTVSTQLSLPGLEKRREKVHVADIDSEIAAVWEKERKCENVNCYKLYCNKYSQSFRLINIATGTNPVRGNKEMFSDVLTAFKFHRDMFNKLSVYTGVNIHYIYIPWRKNSFPKEESIKRINM